MAAAERAAVDGPAALLEGVLAARQPCLRSLCAARRKRDPEPRQGVDADLGLQLAGSSRLRRARSASMNG
jgi:hypothetical protein